MRLLNKINLFIQKAELTLAILAMSGVVGILTAQVFFRYILQSPIFFAEEVALILMVIATFAGLSLLVAEDRLIGIDMLGPHFSKIGHQRLVLFVRLLVALVSGFFAFCAIKYISTPWIWFERFATIPIARASLYSIVTVELCLIVFHQAILALNSCLLPTGTARP